MTFQLDHHNKILTILDSLDSNLLEESQAYFGGGTLLTLDFGEYRWSKDIDFICPIASSGYKHLRTIIFDGGYQALLHDQTAINIQRGTTSQYGIRLLIIVEDEPIKMEIGSVVRKEETEASDFDFLIDVDARSRLEMRIVRLDSVI